MQLYALDEGYDLGYGLVKFELVRFHSLYFVSQSVDQAHQEVKLRLPIIVLANLACRFLKLKCVCS